MKNFLLASLVSLSAYSATIIPFERDISRIEEFSFMMSNNQSSNYYADNYVGDEQDQLYTFGFSFQNRGPNKIVTTTPSGVDYAQRDFYFTTVDKARRDNYLWVTDYNGSGYVSDRYESLMVFLPRENQMHVEETGSELVVTLSTGEEVRYLKESKMITGGVLSEMPLDSNPDRAQRSFPLVKYTGKGLVIRSDARAADPRLAKYVQILKPGLNPCLIASSVFWTQEDFPKFKFVNDEDVMKIILDRCGILFSK